MRGRQETDFGEILIDNNVIAKYAGLTALECMGIVGMAAVSMTDGLVKLLKKENLTRGVHVSVENNEIVIDFHVIISYGVRIAAVADNLISSVKYQVEEVTGLKIKKINVFIDGVRVID